MTAQERHRAVRSMEDETLAEVVKEYMETQIDKGKEFPDVQDDAAEFFGVSHSVIKLAYDCERGLGGI